MIDLSNVAETNIEELDACMNAGGLEFVTSEASPDGAGFFFISYEFSVSETGCYRLSIASPKQQFGRSRYSYTVDDGPVSEVVHKRLVGAETAETEGIDALSLSAGEHLLQLRFYPEQGVRAMNRIDETYLGHRVIIRSIRLVLIEKEEQKPTPAAPRKDSQKLRLQHGDRFAFLGDSITDEEFYPGHIARMIRKAYPEEGIVCYNCGIVNNRSWEGWERLERDVLALKPTWVSINFGVNDGLHMGPEEYERTYEKIILALKKAGVQVLCTTPTGFLAEREKKNGKYGHTRDRAQALDMTAAQEAGIAVRLAKKHDCLWADTLSPLRESDLPRDRLMYNQWHPNEEGGRLIALAALRALGFSRSDVEATGDPMDLEYFKMIEGIPKTEYPSYGVDALVPSKPVAEKLILAASFTQNTLHAFSAVDGEEIARVPVGHHPMAIAYSPKRREIYVTCEAVGRIEVIDARTFEKKEPIGIGNIYPMSIQLTADEDTAWTGSHFKYSVTEIDLQERKVKRHIDVGASVETILLLEEQKMLIAGTKKGLVALDLDKGLMMKRLPIDYVGGLVRLSDDEIGAIDTGFWQMHVLTLPELALKEVMPPPFASRAIVIDDRTGDIFAGDWKKHKLVCLPSGSDEAREIANVEFPFGVAVVNYPE